MMTPEEVETKYTFCIVRMFISVALVGFAFGVDKLLNMKMLSVSLATAGILLVMHTIFVTGRARGHEDAWKEKYLVGSITRNPQDDPYSR